MRPGFGCAAHARSISFSREVATVRYVPGLARGIPGGGMEPARSLAITCSQASALALGGAAARVSRANPAVRSFWLWHVKQYFEKNSWAGTAALGAAAEAGLSGFAV